MESREVISVILLASATWLCLSALSLIAGMIQALTVAASPSQVTALKAGFTTLRDNAIFYLWMAAGTGFLGAFYAAKPTTIEKLGHNEEIREILYLIFTLIAIIGTILAVLST